MGFVRAVVRVLGVSCLVALAGCPTVDLGEEPADVGMCTPNGGIQYFQNQMWMGYIHNTANNCGNSHNMPCDCARAGCHPSPGGAGGLSFDTNVPAMFATDFMAATNFTSCTNPTASLLLTKPLAGIDGHGGGDLFTMSDPQYQLFLNWFK
jgi:hypothetical protein